MGFEHLTDVHTRWYAERVETDFNRSTVGQEGHIFLGHDLGDHTFVTVTTGHLVTNLELLLRGDVNFDLLDHARTGLFTGLDTVGLAILVGVELVELTLVRTDDLHDLDTNR